MNGLALKELARSLAVVMHEGQCRKGTGEPYFNHVERVAQSVKGWEAQTVAYLHDVVEDTAITEADLDKMFPRNIVIAVMLLTRHADGEETYAEFIDRILRANMIDPVTLKSDSPLVYKSDSSLVYKVGAELAYEVKIADIRDNMAKLNEIPGDTTSKEKRYTKALARLLKAGSED